MLWPLVVTWALGSALVIGFAYYFTTQAYDRSLLDDAYALSAQVRMDAQQGLSLSLTDAEMRAVLFDQSESNYFALWRADGRLLAGHVALRPPARSSPDEAWVVDGTAAPTWVDGTYLGRSVRIVSLGRTSPAPFVVVVAQTTQSRNRLLSRLLVAGLVPQVMLLALLAFWLRRQVEQDVQPLSQLRDALEQRDLRDLGHVPPTLAQDAETVDVEHVGRAINALFDRLQQGIAAQREFSGNVAHELRTPLASMRLQAEHALTQSTESVTLERMQRLLASADHASHLIDQLLALAFADEARHTVQLTTLDLVPVVRAATLRHLARADSLRVDLGAEGVDGSAPLRVRGQRVLIDAVLDNLMDNALRYGCGAKQPCITVAARQQENHIWLMVTDNGQGLTPEDMQRYKDRWQQAPRSRQGDRGAAGSGVGLGLSIVSTYADLLGATFVLQKASAEGGLCAALIFAAQS